MNVSRHPSSCLEQNERVVFPLVSMENSLSFANFLLSTEFDVDVYNGVDVNGRDESSCLLMLVCFYAMCLYAI